MNHALPMEPGEGIMIILSSKPSPRPAFNTSKAVLAETYHRLAVAEQTGRATLNPAQTALVAELVLAAFQRGVSVARVN